MQLDFQGLASSKQGSPSAVAVPSLPCSWHPALPFLPIPPDWCLLGVSQGSPVIGGPLGALGGCHWSPASSWQGASSTAVRPPMSVRSPSGDARPVRLAASPSACGWACSRRVSAGQCLGETGVVLWVGWKPGEEVRGVGLCGAAVLGHSLVLQFKGYVWTASEVGDRSTSGGQRWTRCPFQAPSLLVLWQ